MKRFPIVIGLLSALVLLTMLFGISQSQQPGLRRHLDLTSPSGTDLIPGYCTIWQEIYPGSNYYHQTGYVDGDKDEKISPCDMITLGDVRHHIVDVVPTFYFSTAAGELLFEGQIDYYQYESQNPICQTWVMVMPHYMKQFHVDNWSDGDGDGVLSIGDDVLLDHIDGEDWPEGDWLHIQRIGLDIVVGEEENPVERGTWGNIKSFFRQLVH